MLAVLLLFMVPCFKWPPSAFKVSKYNPHNIMLKDDQKQTNRSAYTHMRNNVLVYSQGSACGKINSMIFLKTCSERSLLTERTMTNVVIYQIHARASVQTRPQPAIIYILGACSSCRTEKNK